MSRTLHPRLCRALKPIATILAKRRFFAVQHGKQPASGPFLDNLTEFQLLRAAAIEDLRHLSKARQNGQGVILRFAITFSNRAARRLRNALTYTFIAVVVFALLCLGSVQRLPFLLACCAMLPVTLAAALLIGEPSRGRGLFRAALLLLTVTCAWVLLQSLQFLGNPLAHPAWVEASRITGITGGSVSVSPADTLAAVLPLAMPLVTFMTGLILCTSDERAEKMLRRLTLVSAAIAIFGLLQFLVAPRQLLLWEKTAYLDSLTTVFVNRNTAATYLGLTMLGLTVICAQYWHQGRYHLFRRWVLKGVLPRSIDRMLWPGLVVLMLTFTVMALMLTRSRAGISSSLVGMLVLIPFLATGRPVTRRARHGRPRPRSRWRTLMAVAAGIAVVLLFLLLFAGRMLQRAQVRGEDDRFCIMPGIFKAIGEFPLTGTGFGTFADVFPAYRDPHCWLIGVWERAHNSYLEGMLGLGILFPMAILFGFSVLFWTLGRGLKDRRRLRLYPALGVAAVLLVALHAILDFSLQIPGFAVFFAAFIAPLASIALGVGRHTVAQGNNA
jgi:O-antigen ligase